MAVKSKDELLESLKQRFGEDNSDEALSFIEDVTDTFGDYETRLNEAGDWKTKYEENDAEWRQKYKDRFFSGDAGISEPLPETDVDETKITSYEQLFTEEV